MNKKLLDILVCPFDKVSSLELFQFKTKANPNNPATNSDNKGSESKNPTTNQEENDQKIKNNKEDGNAIKNEQWFLSAL